MKISIGKGLKQKANLRSLKIGESEIKPLPRFRRLAPMQPEHFLLTSIKKILTSTEISVAMVKELSDRTKARGRGGGRERKR